MKVLFIASEMEGLVKTGGLADVARALPEELMQQGIEVKVVIPFYKNHIRQEIPVVIPAVDISLSEDCRFGVAIRKTEVSNITVYLVEYNRFFDRAGIYDDGYHAYEDNAIRYALLSKSALNLCGALNWFPDIIHCNDWQTAITPYYLKHHMTGHLGFKNTKSILTIHNGFFQGRIPNPLRKSLGIDEKYYKSTHFEDHQMVNLLKGGLMFADAVTTVSPGYRDELLQEETSHGMWQTFLTRREQLTGIINGCDYSQWDPETDTLISNNYNQNKLAGKQRCKLAIQQILNLKKDKTLPVFGLVSRITDQKGFDTLIPALEQFLSGSKAQVILLGSGDPVYMEELNELELKFSDKFRFHQGYNNSLAHKIEAGSDFFLMPSLFEPCGLNQIYSLKYGTLPIVRSIGGLKNTVVGLKKNHSNIKTATGFSFEEPTIANCLDSLNKATNLWYKQQDKYLQMQQTAMSQDFSWKQPAKDYMKLYQDLIAGNA